MKTRTKLLLLLAIFILATAASLLFLCTTDIAVLNPKGLIGEKEKALMLTTNILMLIVVIPVLILTFWIAWKYRIENKKAEYTPNWDHSLLAESIWWGIPCAIIIVLGAINWKACYELDPFNPIKSDIKPLTIQVVALRWKWLFIYPEQKIATVGFIQFPEKTPIVFEITADAPMNSFWIPELGGQIYAMPGMRSHLNLISNEVGSFRGSSANLSGKGFAGMTFLATATTKEDFDQWVLSVQESPDTLNLELYHKLTQPSEYNPKTSYNLEKNNLFDQIIMKYETHALGSNDRLEFFWKINQRRL